MNTIGNFESAKLVSVVELWLEVVIVALVVVVVTGLFALVGANVDWMPHLSAGNSAYNDWY